MKKFTMELVWHNCWKCPPEEATNDYLIATDGDDVYDAAWYAPDGFMIRNKHDGWWHGLYEDLGEWYWADLKQTVQGDSRFKGLIKDDLVGLFDKGGEIKDNDGIIGSIYNEFINIGYSERDSSKLANLAVDTAILYGGCIDITDITKALIDMFKKDNN